MNSRRKAGWAVLALALALLALASSATAAVRLQKLVNLPEPMSVTSPPDEPNRLLIAERAGRIEQDVNGAVTNFADLSSVVACCERERGLQSIAVAPDFATSGRVYVDYTDTAGNNRIAEIRASGRGASISTLRNVITIPYQPDANHLGGQIQFGPDGDLYISSGDGGVGGNEDEHHNAQSLSSLLGKLLRIDPAPSGGSPYSVPTDNPFASIGSPYTAIWSLGLRNPFRFSFDRGSGALVIADVGEREREEVDYLPYGASSGANFGWNCFEGQLPGAATDPECKTPPAAGYVKPIFEYPHKNTGGAYGCAIIGGYVVRDRNLGDLYGRYVYTDYCTADVRSFVPSDPYGTDRSEGLRVGEATSFGEDSCGRIYVADQSGDVFRLVGAKSGQCREAVIGVKIRTSKRGVQRGGRALVTTKVTPCGNHAGVVKVALYRGKTRVGMRKVNAKCVASFHPRLLGRSSFRARVAPGVGNEAAASPRLWLRPRP